MQFHIPRPKPRNVNSKAAVMIRLYMIQFEYQRFTYYANVIEYVQTPPVFHIDILTSRQNIPKRLIMTPKNGQWELSNYSLLANAELVAAIGQKLVVKGKSEVA